MSIVLGRKPGGSGGGGGAPSGPAGGDLSGTYPNPSLAVGFDAYAVLTHSVNDGTAGGTFTAGAWQTRPLNTEVDPDGIVTLASNQFTLQAGGYLILARAEALAVDNHRTRIQDITNAATLISGSNANCPNSIATMIDSWAIGRIDLAGATVLELQHRCETTRSTDGWGGSLDWGTNVVYAAVVIYREA